MAAPLDRAALRALASEGTLPALIRDLAGPPAAPSQAAPGQAAPGQADVAARLARLPSAQRRERLVAIVAEEVARALGLRSGAQVRTDQPLRDAGLDR